MKTESKPSPRSLWRKWIHRFFLLLIAFGLGLWIVIWFVAPQNMVQPPRTGRDVVPAAGIVPFALEVAPNTRLAVWQAAPVGKPRAAVIVLHGIADSKASAQGSLVALSGMGLLALAPDLRAHGESDGFASYGFHEKADLTILREKVENEHPGIPVGLWGTSYGGAVALQTAAADARFDFVIVESTFSSLHEIACDQVSAHTHAALAWVAPIALRRAGGMAHFDATQVNPARAAASISAPILHLHGDSDEVIPVAHAHRIRDAATGRNYRYVTITGGGHYHLRQTDPTTYDRETSSFLAEVVGE